MEDRRPPRNWWHVSGLDTSEGLDFVQQRLWLFATVLALVSLAFFVVGIVAGLVVKMPWGTTSRPMIAHLAALLLLIAIVVVTRRGRLSLKVLERLDALALIGTSFLLALFIVPPITETIYSAVQSVAITVLARTTMVPSNAGRTLRLTVPAVLPTIVLMWLWRGQFTGPPGMAAGPTLTMVFQTLLLAAVVWLATITSGALYQLRRRVKEANELGAYALEDKLGGGGMGEVWRARHQLLARSAAVKLIRPELLATSSGGPDAVLRRFEREARATAALRSPHTVQLYDFGQAEDGTLYYVMELIDGIDLDQLVTRFGPVPAERAVYLVRQMCRALDEAHRHGLTHRDIKPANVIVSGSGEPDFAKVLDFGLVALRATGGDGKLTAEASVPCTPAYAAPEVARGEPRFDHRVDIYATGCVLYWLLTGQLVFEASSPMALLVAHASAPPPRPGTRTELPIPPELEQLVMECLEKDPARRPQSAEELAQRLAEVPLAVPWNREHAAAWWLRHAPVPEPRRSVADELLSRERTPAARVLRPRRG